MEKNINVGTIGTIASGLGGVFSIKCIKKDSPASMTKPLTYWKITNPGWSSGQYDYSMTEAEAIERITFKKQDHGK